MKKNISAALLTAACFSALSAAAFADGPIGGAINGIGRAGEDIADGAGDAVSDIADGVTGDDSDTADSDNDTLDPGGSDSDTTPDDSSVVVPDDSSDTVSDDSIDTSDTSSDSESSESGIVGGITDVNPPAGVSYGLTAGAAVLAALGVVVAASARKDK